MQESPFFYVKQKMFPKTKVGICFIFPDQYIGQNLKIWKKISVEIEHAWALGVIC